MPTSLGLGPATRLRGPPATSFISQSTERLAPPALAARACSVRSRVTTIVRVRWAYGWASSRSMSMSSALAPARVVELDAARGSCAAGLPGGRVSIEAHDDAKVQWSPARKARQEPGHAALVAAAAHGVQQVVAVDEQEIDVLDASTLADSSLVLRVSDRVGGYHRVMLLLVDLDGVVYRGTRAVPGMPELLTQRVGGWRHHRLCHQQLALASYASTRSDSRAWALRRRSSASSPPPAGPPSLSRHCPVPPRSTMVFGGDGLRRELEDVGLRHRRLLVRGPRPAAGRGRLWGRLRPLLRAAVVCGHGHSRRGLLRGHQPRPHLSHG